MAKNIRISDELYRLALRKAQLQERSIAQQMEYWAKLGMALELQQTQANQTVTSKASSEQKEKAQEETQQESLEFLAAVAQATKQQEKDRQDIKDGKISAQALACFTKDYVKKATVHWKDTDFTEFNYVNK